MATQQWVFSSRFRRNAFGWKSDLPIKRIKEAISEIKAVARKDPVLAAEGAVLLLTKVAPAIEHVDSSSGSMGSAVNRAIETLVPIISVAPVSDATRQRWLDRLWAAIEDDGCSYIESLTDYWGDLCGEPHVALYWIELFRPTTEMIWRNWRPGSYDHYHGQNVCLSSMIKAGQFEELLALLDLAPYRFWHNHRWGVKALVALGRGAEAIRYAEACRGLNAPDDQISGVCEDILLRAGLSDEAYRKYALAANQGTTHLATHRALVKKYPGKAPVDILRDLIASTPGAEGKWFAAAKDAGCFDLAIDLVNRSYTDPRTLVRSAREAERAHVHRNTPTARPQAPQLQKYLRDMVRVLAIATEMTGDEKRAAFLLRNEPLRAFGYKTADTLIQEGKADMVIAFLESLMGGAAG